MIKINFKIASLLLIAITGCSTWNDEFEGEVVRAHPNASIHQLSQMMDKGLLKESDNDLVLSNLGVGANKVKVFKDGEVSRGVEDVRRMYMTTYEDSSKNLHTAHHLYFVVKPAEWMIQ